MIATNNNKNKNTILVMCCSYDLCFAAERGFDNSLGSNSDFNNNRIY